MGCNGAEEEPDQEYQLNGGIAADGSVSGRYRRLLELAYEADEFGVHVREHSTYE